MTTENNVRVPWQDRARDMLRRLSTMQPPNVVLQQITMLGEARGLLEEALAAPAPAGGPMCPECKLGHLLYECPACSASNYPAPAGAPYTRCRHNNWADQCLRCNSATTPKPEQGAGLADIPGSDTDLMRDVYMTATQRAAFDRIVALARQQSRVVDGWRVERVKGSMNIIVSGNGQKIEVEHGEMLWGYFNAALEGGRDGR